MAATKVRTYNYLISCGHLCSDINQGALAAVLPFLIAAYHYDYATAATLVLFSNLVGSVVQPIFGQLADRFFCARDEFFADAERFDVGFDDKAVIDE